MCSLKCWISSRSICLKPSSLWCTAQGPFLCFFWRKNKSLDRRPGSSKGRLGKLSNFIGKQGFKSWVTSYNWLLSQRKKKKTQGSWWFWVPDYSLIMFLFLSNFSATPCHRPMDLICYRASIWTLTEAIKQQYCDLTWFHMLSLFWDSDIHFHVGIWKNYFFFIYLYMTKWAE